MFEHSILLLDPMIDRLLINTIYSHLNELLSHIRLFVKPRGYSLLLYTGRSMSIFGVWDFTKIIVFGVCEEKL